MGLDCLSGVFWGTHPAQLMSKNGGGVRGWVEAAVGRSMCQRVVIDLSVALPRIFPRRPWWAEFSPCLFYELLFLLSLSTGVEILSRNSAPRGFIPPAGRGQATVEFTFVSILRQHTRDLVRSGTHPSHGARPPASSDRGTLPNGWRKGKNGRPPTLVTEPAPSPENAPEDRHLWRWRRLFCVSRYPDDQRTS